MEIDDRAQADTGPTAELSLRASVGVLARVVFEERGGQMLALERKATLLAPGGQNQVRVRAQPFGGAVRLLEPHALAKHIGPWRYDSGLSRAEQDLRIFMRPGAWEALRRLCIQQFTSPVQDILDSDPARELEEEFADALHIHLSPEQYTCRPLGVAEERSPTPTDNIHASGSATVRLYHVHEVRILDRRLVAAMLQNSQDVTDQALVQRALQDARQGGRGRANAVLALPLDLVRAQFRAIPGGERHAMITLDGHFLEGNIQALFTGNSPT